MKLIERHVIVSVVTVKRQEMTTLTIDTYRVLQKLQSKGYSKEQAEGFVEVIQDISLDEISTKSDISALKTDISAIDNKLHTISVEIKYDILKWVIPLIFGLYGLIIFKIH